MTTGKWRRTQWHTCCVQDGGGISSDGALPQAKALSVSSERELHGELDKIVGLLSKGAAAVDWEQR